ncbi:GIN domain-containing protein [Gluconacetobacter sp. Hr-1-5]|uniref:GIN domain-containing protein n=1 Tax=Gluconacetobacter sp. Hr-1-5 TaxID=3395370 RepID=UPI003B517442
MIRGLILVAVGGAFLSMTCFAVAAVRGPISWNVSGWDLLDDDDGGTPAAPAVSRKLDWKGGEALTFELPASIVYTQGPAAGITVTGARDLVDRVKLDGDELSIDHVSHHHWHNRHLQIVVTAPALKMITLRSAGSLTLNDVAVDHLSLTVEGAGSVTGHGKADMVVLKVAGAAQANLSDMVVRDADIGISGAGHVSIGPSGHASVRLSGVGAVNLTRKPASLTKEVSGIGSITVDGGDHDDHDDDTPKVKESEGDVQL